LDVDIADLTKVYRPNRVALSEVNLHIGVGMFGLLARTGWEDDSYEDPRDTPGAYRRQSQSLGDGLVAKQGGSPTALRILASEFRALPAPDRYGNPGLHRRIESLEQHGRQAGAGAGSAGDGESVE